MAFTTFYCLLGLAIISMGISLSAEEVTAVFGVDLKKLMNEQFQVKHKADMFAHAVGFKEDEEAVRRRMTLTRCTDVRETPKDKTGNKHDFFSMAKPGRGNVNIYDIDQ